MCFHIYKLVASQDHDTADDHQYYGYSGSHRPVVGCGELTLDHITNIDALSSTKHIGDEEVRHSRDKHKYDTTGKSRKTYRKDHFPEQLEVSSSQISSRLQNGGVDLLHIGIQWQDHKRDGSKYHTKINGKICAEHLNRLIYNVKIYKDRIDDSVGRHKILDGVHSEERVGPGWNHDQKNQ